MVVFLVPVLTEERRLFSLDYTLATYNMYMTRSFLLTEKSHLYAYHVMRY